MRSKDQRILGLARDIATSHEPWVADLARRIVGLLEEEEVALRRIEDI